VSGFRIHARTDHVEDEALLRALGYIASEPVRDRTGVLRHDPTSAYPGWNLYVTQGGLQARLIDMDGRVLHVWRAGADAAATAAWKWWRTVHLFPNGDLLTQTDNGSLDRIDWDSNIIWSYPGETHHDFDLRDDGHIFVLTKSRRRVPGFEGKISEDFVVELDPGGRELRSVSIVKALLKGRQMEILAELKRHQREVKGIRKIDPLHVNSVEVLDGRHVSQLPAFKSGNLLIGLPLIGRVAVLDFEAERVVWSLKGSFRIQHDPTMLTNGNMLIFDNLGLAGERSRALEINPATGEEVWSHGGTESQAFYSKCCGRVARLANGNTLVVVSKDARAFEIDPAHSVVWEFRSADKFLGNAANLNDLLRLPVNELLLKKASR
jgi:hypothetical protein